MFQNPNPSSPKIDSIPKTDDQKRVLVLFNLSIEQSQHLPIRLSSDSYHAIKASIKPPRETIAVNLKFSAMATEQCPGSPSEGANGPYSSFDVIFFSQK